ncbi:MAG: AAA family ATPase [Desulfobacteraceae bacterium]|nr:AAA family ATPase [Desulfobacteraceae bacterium]
MTHKKKLPIGRSDFKAVIEDNCYYVDKSLFIREITEASGNVLLIPRPRRFGKTLNLSMLRYFYEKADENLSRLFKGMAVSKDKVFENHQGKYPVIFLTFKDAKEMSWKSLYPRLANLIRDEFVRHKYLLESDVLFHTEKHYFESVLNKKAEEADYADALRYLSAFLRRFHEKRVIILADEYDTPITAGYIGGYYKNTVNFMRNLLSGGLKDNEHLFKGVVTGVLRVAKESIFSGLNNLDVFTLLDDEFSSGFGFTDDEVQRILKDYSLSDRYEEVSHWYNGYLFGGKVVYNPWSVVNYVNRKSVKARPYWIRTADTEMIDSLATRGGRELREELGNLLEGKSIIKPVYDDIVMKDLEKRDDLLWSFLLFSGYLKVAGEIDYETYRLKIPNQEVLTAYEKMVRTWFAEKTESNRLEAMLKALEDGNAELFEQLLREVVIQVMSYHDLSGSPEKVYHALVLGMLVWMSDRYDIRSNRESGYGRFDLMLKPKDAAKQGIIIEFKKVHENETPEDVLKSALEQIEEKKYAEELEASGVKNILKLAVAFQGKKLWVRQEQNSTG